jgi:hypothetical protein
MVGAWRFELQASCAQGRRATRLRYAPTFRTFDSTAICSFVFMCHQVECDKTLSAKLVAAEFKDCLTIICRLHCEKARVDAICGEKIVMRSLFRDLTVGEDNDSICDSHG